jgi:hypothetical protein
LSSVFSFSLIVIRRITEAGSIKDQHKIRIANDALGNVLIGDLVDTSTKKLDFLMLLNRSKVN